MHENEEWLIRTLFALRAIYLKKGVQEKDARLLDVYEFRGGKRFIFLTLANALNAY